MLDSVSRSAFLVNLKVLLCFPFYQCVIHSLYISNHICFLHFLKARYTLFPPLRRTFVPKTLSLQLDSAMRRWELWKSFTSSSSTSTAGLCYFEVFKYFDFLAVYTFYSKRPFKTHIFHMLRQFISIHLESIIHMACMAQLIARQCFFSYLLLRLKVSVLVHLLFA